MSKLPNGWEKQKISTLSKVVRGASPRPAGHPKYFDGDYIPWLTVARLTNISEAEMYVTQATGYLTEEGAKFSRIIEEGTPIISNSGATLGVAKILGITCCANDGIAALIDLDNRVNKEFLCYYINTQTDRLREVIAPGNGQPNLNTSLIGDIEIPLPPLPEQRKIAAILSTWDEAIALTQQLIAALQQRKQALMQLLLTGHKVLPDNWKWGYLDEFLHQDRKYVTKLENKLYPRISVKWWAKGAVVAGYDNGLEVKMARHQLAKPGQIIVSEIWAKHGSIGIIPVDGEGALITSHFFLFDFKSNVEVEQDFIYKLVDGNYFMKQADSMSKGTTGYASVRASDFLRFKLPLPSIEEQRFIADVLATSDDLLQLYENYSSQLQTQKRGLMQRLLTGAVRVSAEE